MGGDSVARGSEQNVDGGSCAQGATICRAWPRAEERCKRGVAVSDEARGLVEAGHALGPLALVCMHEQPGWHGQTGDRREGERD